MILKESIFLFFERIFSFVKLETLIDVQRNLANNMAYCLFEAKSLIVFNL